MRIAISAEALMPKHQDGITAVMALRREGHEIWILATPHLPNQNAHLYEMERVWRQVIGRDQVLRASNYAEHTEHLRSHDVDATITPRLELLAALRDLDHQGERIFLSDAPAHPAMSRWVKTCNSWSQVLRELRH